MSGVVKTIAKPVTNMAAIGFPQLAKAGKKVGGVLGEVTGYSAQQEAERLAREAAQRALLPRSTQYGSSVNPATGYTYLDPSIRTMRESVLQQLPSYRSGYQGAYDTLKSGVDDYLARTRGYLGDLNGNMNPYIQARVNPLLERASLGRGSLERGLALRGLGGSSFAAQSLGSYDTATSRAEADQRAQALQEALQARNALSQQLLGGAASLAEGEQSLVDQNRALDQQIQSVAAQNLQQELSALGLSQSDISAILNSAQVISASGEKRMNMLGRLLDAGGSFIKGPAGGSGGGGSLPV